MLYHVIRERRPLYCTHLKLDTFRPCADSSLRRGMVRKEAWPFYRTISGVRLCWELEEPKGPEGSPLRDTVYRDPEGEQTKHHRGVHLAAVREQCAVGAEVGCGLRLGSWLRMVAECNQVASRTCD